MLSTRYASALYSSAHRAARLRQAWAKVRGQSYRLLDLTTVAATYAIGDRHTAGMQTVSIRQIRGSEGRCDDFDVAFRPLKAHTAARWVSVARTYLRGIGLPAVELIQVGAVYFVRDGHHRISVAAALGQQEVDAVVTVWQVAEPVIEEHPIRKEHKMNPFIDDSRARYLERLQEVEQWRLARLACANRANWSDRLRVHIGERLITLGQHLKAAAPPTPQFD
jgi:hypothetical protein